MKHGRTSALVVALLLAGGCAHGGFVEETAGAGGGSTSTSSSGPISSSSTSSASTTTASVSAGSTSSSSTSSSASSSVASSSSSGLMCDSDEHACNGMCAGNTIQTGCFLSASCAPCPAPPLEGTEICNTNGQCDFTCPGGYNKVGSACACATQCCKPTDCGANQACNGGTCVDLCNSDDCTASCVVMCFPDFGIGQCNGGNCNCVCI